MLADEELARIHAEASGHRVAKWPVYRGIPRQCHHETCDHFFEYHCTEDCKVDRGLSVGQNRSTQEAGEPQNGEQVADTFSTPDETLRAGFLTGLLMEGVDKAGQAVNARLRPTKNADGEYTRELEITFDFFDKRQKATLRIESITDDDNNF